MNIHRRSVEDLLMDGLCFFFKISVKKISHDYLILVTKSWSAVQGQRSFQVGSRISVPPMFHISQPTS